MTPAEARSALGRPDDAFAEPPPSDPPPPPNPKRAALIRGWKTLKRIVYCLDEAGEKGIADALSVRCFHLIFKILDGEIVECPPTPSGAATLPSTWNLEASEVTVDEDSEFGGSDSHRPIVLSEDHWTSRVDGNLGYTAGLSGTKGFAPSMFTNPHSSDALMALVLNHEVGHCRHDSVGPSSSNPRVNECRSALNELRVLETDLDVLEFLKAHPGCIADPILPNFYRAYEDALKDYKLEQEKRRDANC